MHRQREVDLVCYLQDSLQRWKVLLRHRFVLHREDDDIVELFEDPFGREKRRKKRKGKEGEGARVEEEEEEEEEEGIGNQRDWKKKMSGHPFLFFH
jgi:Ran GTPase-activating protein (RanGAP) involved in mRNA processing and transport